jgi:enoyl-CoA hydratase/carnithine racemase
LSEESFISLRGEGRIRTVTIERPETRNAISTEVARELTDVCSAVAEDEDVWVVVLTAAGDRAFCVGADLKERASFTLDDYHANRGPMKAMFEAVRAIPQPSIASIFGFALGGGFELALSCDLIVAAEGTQVGLPEARVGLLPAGGGTQLLTRKVGPSKAKELIFTGERVDVGAVGQGLIHDIVPFDSLHAATMRLAERITEASPIALREAKASIDATMGIPLEKGIAVEHESWARVVASDDRAEGIAAFNEKRPPEWTNR